MPRFELEAGGDLYNWPIPFIAQAPNPRRLQDLSAAFAPYNIEMPRIHAGNIAYLVETELDEVIKGHIFDQLLAHIHDSRRFPRAQLLFAMRRFLNRSIAHKSVETMLLVGVVDREDRQLDRKLDACPVQGRNFDTPLKNGAFACAVVMLKTARVVFTMLSRHNQLT